MYRVLSKERIQIYGSLTIEEIKMIVSNQYLRVIQFSEPLDDETYAVLDAKVFAKRDDVALRAYGFYEHKCDLQFLENMPHVKRFEVDSHQDVKNLNAIKDLPQLIELSLSVFTLDSFNLLDEIPNTLEHLDLGQTKSKKPDLKVLQRFTRLKSLYIDGHQKNINVISTLFTLESITLRSVKVETLDFLVPLNDLRSLDIKLGGITNFSAIKDMHQLERLELWQIRGLTDIAFISELKGLQSLSLQSLPHIHALPDLSPLIELKEIMLENMKGLTDLACLEHAPSLEEFVHWSATRTRPEDYIPLLQNPSLKRVAIGFGTDKRNNQFEELVRSYGKEVFNPRL